MLATVFVSLPLVIREVVPVLEEIGIEQEQAARSLGANAVQTFRRVTLPSIRWAVVYGVVLSLARALGEFGAVKIVSGNLIGQTQTATLLVEQKYQDFEQGTAYAAAFLLASASVLCLLVVALVRPREEVVVSIEVVGSTSASATSWRSRTSRSASAPASSRPCWARVGEGSPPSCASSPGWSRRTPARSRSRAPRPRTCRRRSATSASCSSTTPRSST